ncbi:NADP-dependent oxidoreductase domain-containing protein [Rhodotorula diobovata]|uniref:NADP-dependent oxidoreductase domain-containing protein n=1 Tax=Rhodotorula diobovata TaxID=5288 RepID=A0A5C5G5A6_9BASI|nr:NADP-dependent oxidoreductase domain-containing protein [Rhodotorula diobovata]
MPFPSFKVAGSSVRVPGLAFGSGSTWRSNPRPLSEDGTAPAVVEAVQSAVAAGFRHFDCAEAYQTDRSVGAALAASGVPRPDLFVTSKVFRALPHVEDEVQRQLRELRIEQFDLFLIHTPKATEVAGLTHAEAWARLEGLVDKGWTRAIGVSNYTPSDLDSLLPHARIPPAVNQVSIYPYIYHRVLPTITYCEARGILIEAYELASSLVRPSEQGGPLDPVLERIVDELAEASRGKRFTPGQVLLAWASAKGWVAVTTSSKRERQEEYVGAGEISLTAEQVAAIDAAGKAGAEQGYGTYSSWS